MYIIKKNLMNLHYIYMIISSLLAFKYANDDMESNQHKIYMGLTSLYAGKFLYDMIKK